MPVQWPKDGLVITLKKGALNKFTGIGLWKKHSLAAPKPNGRRAKYAFSDMKPNPGQPLAIQPKTPCAQRLFCQLFDYFFIGFVLLLTVFSAPALSVPQTDQKDILLLNSYHRSLPWTDNMVSAIVKDMDEAGYLDLDIEYMDTKQYGYDEAYIRQLEATFEFKFKNRVFDLIITTDDNALDFVINHHDSLFHGSPVIFTGINNKKVPYLIDRNHFTGVMERPAIGETLALMLELYPATRHIVLIYDDTPSGEYRWQLMTPYFKQYSNITFERRKGEETIEELENYLSTLGDHSLVLFASYYRDSTGQFIALNEGSERVTITSRRPVFTLHRQIMRTGTMGGKLISGQQQGHAAAQMALEVLRGTPVADIPVQTESLAQYIFNYDQLQRFKVDLDLLPEGSEIIGKPISLYDEYGHLILAAGLLILALVVINVLLLSNIRIKRSTNKKLAYIANIDSLTQLKNQYNLTNWLNSLDETTEPFTLFLFDIDHFSYLRNHHGETVADSILVTVAERLKTVADFENIYYIGEDKFALIQFDSTQSPRTANMLMSAVTDEPFTFQSGEVTRITLSGGSVHCSQKYRPKQVLRYANLALYQARKNGGNNAVSYSSDIELLFEQIAKAKQVIVGMIARHQRMSLHFQPIIEFKSGQTVGYEALLRIEDNQGRIIPPPVAVMAFEHSGLIRQLNQDTIEAAYQLISQFGGELFVDINLTRMQLLTPSLIDDIQSIAARYQQPLSALSIEVVENEHLEDNQIIGMLKKLRGLGLQVALDDFGTGYSSISSLRRLPLDVAKLDKAFLSDPLLRGNISSVNEFCEALGLDVISEGVETEEDARLCRESGCKYGQGYFFSHPMPLTELLYNNSRAMLTKKRAPGPVNKLA